MQVAADTDEHPRVAPYHDADGNLVFPKDLAICGILTIWKDGRGHSVNVWCRMSDPNRQCYVWEGVEYMFSDDANPEKP